MLRMPHRENKTRVPITDVQVTLLENVRFYKEETKNVPEFAEKMAANADMFVNDAFGALCLSPECFSTSWFAK